MRVSVDASPEKLKEAILGIDKADLAVARLLLSLIQRLMQKGAISASDFTTDEVELFQKIKTKLSQIY